MTNPVLLAVVGTLCIVLACGLVMGTFVWRQRRTVSSDNNAVTIKPCAGPMARLDFAQSLDPIAFATAAEAEAVAYAGVHLAGHLADGTTITLQFLKELATRSQLLVGASPEATQALRAGTAVIQKFNADGRFLPHVADAKNGRVIEVMKEAGYGRKAIAGAAAASAIIVSAAHIIATADLARSVRLIDQKLDMLLAYRRIDQDAALERIYTEARELLLQPLGELQRIEIWRLRGELRELRITWRRELEHHLRQIENPAEEAWISRMFTFQSDIDKRIGGKISGAMIQLAMVEYSLRIDRLLASATDNWDVSERTLADELAAIERVGKLLAEKAAFISEKRRGSAQPMINGIAAIVSHYRATLRAQAEGVIDGLGAASTQELLANA